MSTIPKDEIWFLSRGRYKAFVADPKKARKIAAWKGCRKHATYYYPNGQIVQDILVPARRYRRACKVMGLPVAPKSPGRVAAGKKSGRTAVERGLLKKGTEVLIPIDSPMVGT